MFRAIARAKSFSMLLAVTVSKRSPSWVRSDGGYDSRVAFPGLRYADGIGPAGWNATIAGLVDGAAAGLTR